jgi:hypothetical protein
VLPFNDGSVGQVEGAGVTYVKITQIWGMHPCHHGVLSVRLDVQRVYTHFGITGSVGNV